MTKSRITVYITTASFSAIWLAIFFVAIFPFSTQIKKEASAYRVNQVQVLKLSNQGQDIARLNKEMSRLSQYKPALENYFLKKEKALEFIESLEVIARATIGEFNIQNVESAVRAGAQQGSLSFQVEFNGEFTGIIRFLSAIETMPYLIEIENLQMSRTETGPTGGKVISVKGVVMIRVLAFSS